MFSSSSSSTSLLPISSHHSPFPRRPQSFRLKSTSDQSRAMSNAEVGGQIGSLWRLKRALGQRLNTAGISSFLSVATMDRHLALPHLSVPDVRWVDWEALERAGFRGVVFDKDNTITLPYQLALWPPLHESFRRCREAFRGKIAVLSNSAGLDEYDPDGSHAREIENSNQGVHVIRHRTKKPAGGTKEIEKYFGCSASHLIMVGDRYFTDIVYGNQNGFLTILTEPLSVSEEPLIVQQVRKCENYLVNSWSLKGIKPPQHALSSGAEQFARNPSL